MELVNFKKTYPAYNGKPDKQILDAVRVKFPVYSDMGDPELSEALEAKFTTVETSSTKVDIEALAERTALKQEYSALLEETQTRKINYENARNNWASDIAEGFYPTITNKKERKEFSKTQDFYRNKFDNTSEAKVFKKEQAGLESELNRTADMLGISSPIKRAVEEYGPYVETAMAIGMIAVGSLQAMKSMKDFYGVARLQEKLVKLKPYQQKTLFNIAQKQEFNARDWPSWFRDKFTAHERAELLRGKTVKTFQVRSLFEKFEKAIGVRGAENLKAPEKLAEFFSGPGIPQRTKKDIEEAPLQKEALAAGIKLIHKPVTPTGSTKDLITEATGVRKVGELLELRDDKALRHLIRREQRASKEGYLEGKREGKAFGKGKLTQFKEKLAAAKTDEERRNLVIKLRAEQKASREGYREGKREGGALGKEKLIQFKEKLASAKTEEERRNLVIKLKAEQKASKEGYRFGQKEIKQILKDRDHVSTMVRELKGMEKAILPPDYQNKLNSLLSGHDLVRRSQKTIARREGTKEFVEGLDSGEMFIPKDVLQTAYKKPLNDMSVEELEELHGAAKSIVHLGRLKGKLIAGKEKRDFNKVVGGLTGTIKTNFIKPKIVPEFIVDPKTGQEKVKILTPSERGYVGAGRRNKLIKENIDKYFGMHKKAEAIIESLDGYEPLGPVYQETFHGVKKAEDHEAVKKHNRYDKIQTAMSDSEIDYLKAYNEPEEIEGSRLTGMEKIAVYVNSKNPDNRMRLQLGYDWSDEKIDKIVSSLKPNEKAFADKMMKTVQGQWSEIKKVCIKLLGREPEFVDDYWPVVTDRDLSDQALIRKSEENLFEDIIRKAYVKKGFTISRKGGTDPVSLDFFKVLTDHLDKTDHFITHAIPVRDAQKLIYDPRMKNAITNAVGSAEYDQLKGWLSHVASPQRTPFNFWERTVAGLRHNSTMATLGLKVSVALKQGGSFTQTINRLGVKPALEGVNAFYRNPVKMKEFVDQRSPMMRYRRETFDRELRDYINRNLGNLKDFDVDKHKFYFTMISTVDQLTVYPTWTGAYLQGQEKFKGNEQKAIEYADMITRRTQPASAPKDLPAIQRGSEFQKLFTMFYTHFSNVYNETARTSGMLKQGKISKEEAAVSYWWTVIAPAVIGGVIGGKILKEKGVAGKAKAVGKEIVGYGSAAFPIVGNIVSSMMSGYPYTATPVEQLPKSVVSAVRGKKPATKLKHGIKAAGYLFGLPTPQALITGEGVHDMITGETKNPMRLFLSKYQIGEDKDTSSDIGLKLSGTKLKGVQLSGKNKFKGVQLGK